MYFPLRGSQTTIWLLGSKHLLRSALKSQKEKGYFKDVLKGKFLGFEALVTASCSRDDGCV